eukprot:ANDGO_08500.mRNA.1 hypothetical protein
MMPGPSYAPQSLYMQTDRSSFPQNPVPQNNNNNNNSSSSSSNVSSSSSVSGGGGGGNMMEGQYISDPAYHSAGLRSTHFSSSSPASNALDANTSNRPSVGLDRYQMFRQNTAAAWARAKSMPNLRAGLMFGPPSSGIPSVGHPPSLQDFSYPPMSGFPVPNPGTYYHNQPFMMAPHAATGYAIQSYNAVSGIHPSGTVMNVHGPPRPAMQQQQPHQQHHQTIAAPPQLAISVEGVVPLNTSAPFRSDDNKFAGSHQHHHHHHHSSRRTASSPPAPIRLSTILMRTSDDFENQLRHAPPLAQSSSRDAASSMFSPDSFGAGFLEELLPQAVLAKELELILDEEELPSFRYRDFKRKIFDGALASHAEFLQHYPAHNVLETRLPHRMTRRAYAYRIQLMSFHYAVRFGKTPPFWTGLRRHLLNWCLPDFARELDVEVGILVAGVLGNPRGSPVSFEEAFLSSFQQHLSSTN